MNQIGCTMVIEDGNNQTDNDNLQKGCHVSGLTWVGVLWLELELGKMTTALSNNLNELDMLLQVSSTIFLNMHVNRSKLTPQKERCNLADQSSRRKSFDLAKGFIIL